jgi:hypothetical protein
MNRLPCQDAELMAKKRLKSWGEKNTRGENYASKYGMLNYTEEVQFI